MEVYQNGHRGGTDQKVVYFEQLQHWQKRKNDINGRRLLIEFF